MNPRLDYLFPYPFERQRELLAAVKPPAELKRIDLGIGEPQHPTPKLITESITANLHTLGKYPSTAGTPELRTAISSWLERRYRFQPPDPDRGILPVAGTREALFAFAQAVLDPADPGVVLIPNPFYQIYEGAAIMAGAQPFYVPTLATSGYLPDWSAVPSETWNDVRLMYVCSPGNPAGAVMGLADWQSVFSLADRYGFVIAADECYSEIYAVDPPIGALQACELLGRSFERVVSFNSLSKRSSAPGLRSGFVAGDPEIIRKFLLYRTYHGAAPSLLTQIASVAAWSDETHVVENRSKYRAKFNLAKSILKLNHIPAGGFFLWLSVENDESFAIRAFGEQALTVLPGRYLSRPSGGLDPGVDRVRIALVAEPDVCEEALVRLSECFERA